MAAWMEDDDASELQDYLRGFHSSKGSDVDWKMIMEGEIAVVDDRSRALEMHREFGGGRFTNKGKGKALKCKEENRYNLVSSTVLPTNKFLKNSPMSPSASDCSFQVSSASSLLSDDQPSEVEKQLHARVASSVRTSLHSNPASGFESAEDTRSLVASDHAGPNPQRQNSSGSPSTSPTVTVALPHVQFAADLTLSPASATSDIVATANSVSEELSTVATEAIEGVSRSRYDSSQESREEEGEDGYGDDTFEDGSVLGGSDEECISDSLSHEVEQEYGDSDFEESVAGPSSSKVSDEEEDEDGSIKDGDRTSIDDQHSLKEASHSVVIAQSKKTSSTGVQTDDVATTAIPAGTAPPPPPSLSVLQSLLSMPTISGAGASLRPPSAAVLDDLLRQHIHLARQSMDCTRAMAGRIEASLNTNHRYTTLQDTQKYLATHKPPPLYSRGS